MKRILFINVFSADNAAFLTSSCGIGYIRQKVLYHFFTVRYNYRGGVVVTTLAWFDLALGRNFFFGPKPTLNKIGTWGFPRNIKAVRTGANIPTSTTMAA